MSVGDARAAQVITALISTRMPARPNECADLLLALSENPSHCFLDVARAAVACLDRIRILDSSSEEFDWEPAERKQPLGPEFLEHLLLALQRFSGGTLCGAAAEKISSRPECFSPVTLVAPAIQEIWVGLRQETSGINSSLQHLWTSAAEFLLRRSETPP